MKVTLVYGVDWSGLYIDGALAYEDMTIDIVDGLVACKGYVIDDVDVKNLNDDGLQWMQSHHGGFPESIDEIASEMFE